MSHDTGVWVSPRAVPGVYKMVVIFDTFDGEDPERNISERHKIVKKKGVRKQ
jgi:hypothetical protein